LEKPFEKKQRINPFGVHFVGKMMKSYLGYLQKVVCTLFSELLM